MTFHLVGMEAEIAKDAFSRSFEKHNLRYTKFVENGDANSFQKVFDANVYWNDHPVGSRAKAHGIAMW